MTIETITTIAPGDITAIEFECSACHGKTVLLIDKFKGAPISCPLCDEHERKQWFIPGSMDFNQMIILGQLLRAYSGGSKPEGFILRFHITNPSASGRVSNDRA